MLGRTDWEGEDSFHKAFEPKTSQNHRDVQYAEKERPWEKY